jgi:uncharacterized RDD family membrane protein YckC
VDIRKPAKRAAANATQMAAQVPAGLGRRLAALVYDALLLLALLACFSFAAIVARGGEAVPPRTWWYSVSLILIAFAFFGWSWTHGGQTLGMTAWRIEVMSSDGSPITWRQALVRFCAMCVSALPAGLGFWWAWFDRQGLTWHDRLAHTRVVRKRQYEERPSA